MTCARPSPSFRLLLALGCAIALTACHRALSIGNVAVAVSPEGASILSLASQQFTATVTGSDNQAVAWTVREGASGGTVSAAGLYTAPGVMGTFHVVGTAAADTTQSATATIVVSPAAPVVRPPAISYSPATLTCTAGVSCGLAAPANSGDAIRGFAIAPALPAGLTLDASTGAMVGIPTIASAAASFLVTATNAGGSGSAGVSIAVLSTPPAGLAYSPSAAVCTVYSDCEINAPMSTGGAADSFSISALPSGLSLEPSSGAISGAATAVMAATPFTVTASNGGGSATATITITIAPLEVTALSMGLGHTCIVVSGGVRCWGDDSHGELGNNTMTSPDGTSSYLTPVAALGLEENVTAISGGDFYSCALQGGAAKCWGLNASGTLGDNTTDDNAVPTQVPGLESGVDAISAATTHACAIVDGGVQCWGDNSQGQLGNNSSAMSLVPVQVAGLESGVQAVSAGDSSSCALTSGGQVLCWGGNSAGALGDNTTLGNLIPVAVQGLGSGVQQISVGDLHACALVNGAVFCWGGNNGGQLGDNSGAPSLLPIAMPGATGVDEVRAGGEDTCVRAGDDVKCTGSNQFGQLGGQDDPTFNPNLEQPIGITSGVSVLYTGEDDSCVFQGAQIVCWGGDGWSRQLDGGPTTLGRQPVPLINVAPAMP